MIDKHVAAFAVCLATLALCSPADAQPKKATETSAKKPGPAPAPGRAETGC